MICKSSIVTHSSYIRYLNYYFHLKMHQTLFIQMGKLYSMHLNSILTINYYHHVLIIIIIIIVITKPVTDQCFIYFIKTIIYFIICILANKDLMEVTRILCYLYVVL